MCIYLLGFENFYHLTQSLFPLDREEKMHEERGMWKKNGHGSFQPTQLQQLVCSGSEVELQGRPKMNRRATEV